jgi:serine/threonine protein phosphatase PrpC
VSGRHPLRHVLTNVVGAREQVEFTVAERPLRSAERLLLCSDGLHGELDDTAIAKILAERPEVTAAAERLVEVTLEQRAADNITALVVGVL